MRFVLLILPALGFFAPLQCYDLKSEYFFVTRRDNKEAICTEPITGFYSPFPTFDLDELQIPRDVGFKYWHWLSDWKLQNDTDVRSKTGKKVLIAGNQPFHFVAREVARNEFYILATNISLWMADEDRPHGRGLLFEVDHLNETTKLKDSTLKYCNKNPQRKKAKCTILDYKNGTNFLNDGNHWTEFWIKENPTGVEMFERRYGEDKRVVQCIWNNANISDPFGYGYFDIFAKSHHRNAAFYIYDYYRLDLGNNKKMKRNYTMRSRGEFCVRVWVAWNKFRSYDSNELMQVKNLVSGRVEPPTNTTHDGHDEIYFQWNHLDAGEYEFTLRCDKRQQLNIDLCPDSGSKIWRTWWSIPKAITKCQFRVGRDTEFSAGPSSPPDPTLKTGWNLKDWAYVCDRLGIGSNDTEVQIKFCNWKGCNFSKCPHLHDDPAYIFDF